MFELIMAIIVIYLVVEYVIPFVIAVVKIGFSLAVGASGIVLALAFGAAVVVGAFVSIKNYIIAIRHNINFLHWNWEKSDEPARRSYFFGPGYLQLRDTVAEAFRLLYASAVDMSNTAHDLSSGHSGIIGIVMSIAALVYKVVGYICIYGLGTVLGAALALIHGSITTVFMLAIYVVFSIVWLIDRVYLLKNKIRSICPFCKERFLIPVFECPNCGAKHRRLVPGPFGIWTHRCDCGHKLPATFLNGRSGLTAYCPECDSALVASDARPVVFQLVGGTRSGKTVYLSAFFHQFFEKVDQTDGMTYTITDEYQPFFDDLEAWYGGESCPATTQFNSQMYPVLLNGLGVKRQFSVFDIAGEMFDGMSVDSELAQHQFSYCNGLLFMIDPFSNGTLRSDRERSNKDVSNFSDMPVEDVAANFINYLIRVGHAKANDRCSIPLAVLITKADLREVRQVIGPAKLASIMRSNPDLYASAEEARDEECRKFLTDIGMASAINDLEAQFTNIHYYPVSAQGHSADGTPFEPWGIMDAFDWMLPLADKEMAAVLNPALAETK